MSIAATPNTTFFEELWNNRLFGHAARALEI
jgi:hypothetical protein